MERSLGFLEKKENSSLIIGGKEYHLVKQREFQPVAIYGSGRDYVRIGPASVIEKEVRFQETLIHHGYPVPRIISSGTYGDQAYFMEESIGLDHMGDMLRKDYQEHGQVSEEHFTTVSALTTQLIQAQLRSRVESNPESFYLGIHMDQILQEMPEWEADIQQCFEKCSSRIAVFPYVLTHGDFNAYNFFEKGIIDFGSSFEAPFGYDPVSNIFHSLNFPTDAPSEMTRGYQFSHEQVDAYFHALDIIHKHHDLPSLSEYVDDLLFARTVWTVVGMHSYPVIRKWRMKRFVRLMDTYLSGGSVKDFVLSYDEQP